MTKPEFQFFRDLEKEKFKQIREFMIEVVVATDMKFHFHHIENSKKLGEGFDIENFENLKSISGLILHTTDLSHASKHNSIAE